MDAYDDWKDSDDDSEQEEEAEVVTFKPSYVLIALDTDASMFQTNGSDHSPFQDCIDVCHQIASSLIMVDVSAKSPFGIILAENETARATFVEFDQSIPNTIKMLEDLKKQSNDNLEAKYKRKGDFDLADFFLFSKNKLLQVNADVYKRTIIYITNNDNPVPNDPKLRFKTINESQKFPSIQMELNVLTFNKDFDSDQFYTTLLDASNSCPVEEIKDKLTLTDKLVTLVRTKYKKYKYKLYPFKGDTDRYVEIVINKFIQKYNIAKNRYVTRDTQQDVKKSIHQGDDTGYYECKYAKSEEPLVIDGIEKEALFDTDLPIGFTLLCVGEETSTYGWIIEQPTLMEKYYKETEPIFDSFWQFCKDKSKCLICLRKYRKSGEIRLVEMVPRYVNDTCMFLARALPFGPEIHYPLVPAPEIKSSHEEEDAMRALVEALTFDFNPTAFRDPIVAKKKAYITSQLLQERMEEVADGIPPDEELDERVAVEVENLKRLGLLDLQAGVKRGTENKGVSVKKLKRELK